MTDQGPSANPDQDPSARPDPSSVINDPSSSSPVPEHVNPMQSYDDAVNPILSRFTGIGLITHTEVAALAGAIRQGIANLLSGVEPLVHPDPGAEPDAAALEEEIAEHEDAANEPTAAAVVGTGGEPE